MLHKLGILCLFQVLYFGPLAEWLGKALQKLLQRFESARDLHHLSRHCRDFYLIMSYRVIYNIGIGACLLMLISCFLPWIYFPAINETFTGFHVTRFSTGNYYGKAGWTISALTIVNFILMLIPKVWAKRLNIFLSALLFAFILRTWVIFTGALFEGEIEKKAGIYLIVICSITMLIASVFVPNKGEVKK